MLFVPDFEDHGDGGVIWERAVGVIDIGHKAGMGNSIAGGDERVFVYRLTDVQVEDADDGIGGQAGALNFDASKFDLLRLNLGE